MCVYQKCGEKIQPNPCAQNNNLLSVWHLIFPKRQYLQQTLFFLLKVKEASLFSCEKEW